MKVIDLKDRTIFVDDIIQLYIEGKDYCPERYNIQTTNGTFLVDREDYFKVKDCLLSLNDEVEIIKEDKKIKKLDTKDLFACDDYQNIRLNFGLTWSKINEIIDYIMEDKHD